MNALSRHYAAAEEKTQPRKTHNKGEKITAETGAWKAQKAAAMLYSALIDISIRAYYQYEHVVDNDTHRPDCALCTLCEVRCSVANRANANAFEGEKGNRGWSALRSIT